MIKSLHNQATLYTLAIMYDICGYTERALQGKLILIILEGRVANKFVFSI